MMMSDGFAPALALKPERPFDPHPTQQRVEKAELRVEYPEPEHGYGDHIGDRREKEDGAEHRYPP